MIGTRYGAQVLLLFLVVVLVVRIDRCKRRVVWGCVGICSSVVVSSGIGIGSGERLHALVPSLLCVYKHVFNVYF